MNSEKLNGYDLILQKTEREEQLVNEYRKANPKSRIISILRFIVNTGCRKQKGCVLYGAEGPTWASDWPKTRRAEDWEDEHKHLHGC